MKKIAFNSISCFSLLFTVCVIANAQAADTKKIPEFKVGQVWSYKTRQEEPKSTFVIVKIDKDAKYGNIIHIAVRDLKMKNPRSSDGFSDKINHMPFSEKAILQSADKLVKENVELPDFKSGYDLWREAFDQSRAGFYTISVAAAVSVAEAGLNQ